MKNTNQAKRSNIKKMAAIGSTIFVGGALAALNSRLFSSDYSDGILTSTQTRTPTQVEPYLQTNLTEIDPSLAILIPLLDTLRRFRGDYYSTPKNGETLKKTIEEYRTGLTILRQRLLTLAKGIEADSKEWEKIRQEWNKTHAGTAAKYHGMGWVGYVNMNKIMQELAKVTVENRNASYMDPDSLNLVVDSLTAVEESENIISVDKFIQKQIESDDQVYERYKNTFYALEIQKPGVASKASAIASIAEISRQFSVHFSGSSNASLDNQQLEKLLVALGGEYAERFMRIYEKDESTFKRVELAHIINASRNTREFQLATQAVASTLINGLDFGSIKSMRHAAHLIGPQVTPRHVGTIDDRFFGYPDKYNFTLLPDDYKKMSTLKLIEEIAQRMPNFSYVGTILNTYSSKEPWINKRWSSSYVPILFGIALSSAGRIVFYLGEYPLTKEVSGQGLHYTFIVEENNNLYRGTSLSYDQLENPRYQSLSRFIRSRKDYFFEFAYPFLSGSANLFLIDENQKITELPNTGYNISLSLIS